MPICWTNVPGNLARKLGIPVEKIEMTQKTLLSQSLKRTVPLKPDFLKEYEQELILTAQHKRIHERTPILIAEMMCGT
jgi:hypothetical protein